MREVITTSHAPAAIGPYSQAIRVGDFIYSAGQLGLDPASGKLVEGVTAQTEQALSNLEAILTQAGSSLGDVVKTTVFLKDMADFQAMNGVYGSRFGGNRPARSTVQVAGLPLGGLVEIEVVAFAPRQRTSA